MVNSPNILQFYFPLLIQLNREIQNQLPFPDRKPLVRNSDDMIYFLHRSHLYESRNLHRQSSKLENPLPSVPQSEIQSPLIKIGTQENGNFKASSRLNLTTKEEPRRLSFFDSTIYTTPSLSHSLPELLNPQSSFPEILQPMYNINSQNFFSSSTILFQPKVMSSFGQSAPPSLSEYHQVLPCLNSPIVQGIRNNIQLVQAISKTYHQITAKMVK